MRIMRAITAAIALMALAGCIRDVIEPRMFEPAYPPSRDVDVFYSGQGPAQAGTEIDRISIDTSGGWAVDMAHKRLLDTARARGANAIVISGLDESQVERAMSVSGAKRIIDADVVSGRLIRYGE